LKRIVVILLAGLLGLPSTVFPAAKGEVCAMPRETTAEACSYCASPVPLPATAPILNADCCRFLPKPEGVPEQAGSIVTTPRPLRLLDIAVSLPMIDGVSIPASLAVRAQLRGDNSPPYSPPSLTTRLLL
jgi:hypothetical protein